MYVTSMKLIYKYIQISIAFGLIVRMCFAHVANLRMMIYIAGDIGYGDD